MKKKLLHPLLQIEHEITSETWLRPQGYSTGVRLDICLDTSSGLSSLPGLPCLHLMAMNTGLDVRAESCKEATVQMRGATSV